MIIHLCGPTVYEFEGWIFSFNDYYGGWPYTKELELRKRAGNAFWKVLDDFCLLSKNKRKSYLYRGEL